ncbi:MAG: hypothetical protein IK083_07990 [Abditibacteriota bacterium]|nr:hypothetical protein [Abditibacteriota bacterium]
MNKRETLRMLLTGDPEGGGWADTFLDGLIASCGFDGALVLLAQGEIRRLESEPVSVSEEGGLTVRYEDRARMLRELAARVREQGFEDKSLSLSGTSEVWEKDYDL